MKDKKTGKFLPGNPGGKLKKDVNLTGLPEDDITFIFRQGRNLIRLFDKYGEMPIEELKKRMQESQTTHLKGKDAAVIKFWSMLITHGDMARMKLLLNLYRIPTEVKAMAVDMTGGNVDNSGEESELTKEEKLKLITQMKTIIESTEG